MLQVQLRHHVKGGSLLNLQLLEEMKAAGMTPSKNAYLAALNALGEAGRVESAYALYKEIQAAGVEIDEFGYAALINSYKHANPVRSPAGLCGAFGCTC